MSVFRSQNCWMMSGVRQNVKSCRRTERRVLPPLTRHNTHTRMTALQPGETLYCSLCFCTDNSSEVIPEWDWMGVWHVTKLPDWTGFKNQDIPVTWYLLVHQANFDLVAFCQLLISRLTSSLCYGVLWTFQDFSYTFINFINGELWSCYPTKFKAKLAQCTQ